MLIDDEMTGGGPDCPSEGPGGLGAILMPSAPLKSRKGAFLMLAAPSQARTCPCVLAAPCMDGCVHGWAFLIPLLSAPLFLSFSMQFLQTRYANIATRLSKKKKNSLVYIYKEGF